MSDPSFILCLNSGSSSLKFSFYRMEGKSEERLAHGAVERIGMEKGRLTVRDSTGEVRQDKPVLCADHRMAVEVAFGALEALNLPKPSAVGHRIVHGGLNHTAPEQVTPELVKTLRRLIPLAPLHLPAGILGIEAVASRFPNLMQVACFDTAFHRRMPALAQCLPLPGLLSDQHLCRFGFHGLSYEYITHVLGPKNESRVIIAHLGNGASLAAIKDGQCLDTTMGFTPAGGLMMGTRSGDLDPGVLIYLMRQKGFDAEKLDRLVNQESGLLGVSGVSHDMKTLLERRDHDPNAKLAVDLFCYQVRKHMGALATVLKGLDMVVFTGGIGERAAPVRWEICLGLKHLGVCLDPVRNDFHKDPISSADSPCLIRVIPTKEDLMISRHVYDVVAKRK